MQDRETPGAEELAGSLAARFENRLGLNVQAGSVAMEGVVLSGLGAAESVRLGDEEKPEVENLALAVQDPSDWERMAELQDGRELSADEQAELAALQRKKLGLALGVDVDVKGLEAEGMLVPFLDDAGRLEIRLAAAELSAWRFTLHAEVGAMKGDLPQGVSEPSSPLAAIAAMDDSIYEARIVTLLATLESAQGAAAGLGPNVQVHRASLHMLPEGVLVQLRDVTTGKALYERIGPDGSQVEELPGFPRGEEGNRLVQLLDLRADDMEIDIADLWALIPESEAGEPCEAPEFLELSNGLSGDLVLDITVRTSSRIAPLEIELIVHLDQGQVEIEALMRFGRFSRRSSVLPSPKTLQELLTAAYEAAFCDDKDGKSLVEQLIADAEQWLQEQIDEQVRQIDDWLRSLPGGGAALDLLEDSYEGIRDWLLDTEAGQHAAELIEGLIDRGGDLLEDLGDEAAERIDEAIADLKEAAIAYLKALAGLLEATPDTAVVKISSQDLRWRQEEIDLTDVVRAKLTWPDSNAHIPMRIDGILAVAPNSPVYLVIHVDPFKLDRIMGTPLGVEMMVDGETIPADIPFVLDRVELHEGHSIPITIDTALPDEQLDTAPLKVSAGIPSLSVAEIRALLPGELE